MLALSALFNVCLVVSTKRFLVFFVKLRATSVPVTTLVTFSGCHRGSSRTNTGCVLATLFSDTLLLFNLSVVCNSTKALCFSSLPTRVSKGPLRVVTFMFFFANVTFGLSLIPFRL